MARAWRCIRTCGVFPVCIQHYATEHVGGASSVRSGNLTLIGKPLACIMTADVKHDSMTADDMDDLDDIITT